MLTCIARSKQGSDDSASADHHLHHHQPGEKINPNAVPTKHAIKALSSQIKDMALKASGAYRHCAPCANQPAAAEAGASAGAAGESLTRWRRTSSGGRTEELAARTRALQREGGSWRRG
ncbi:protein Brevis radix-like 4 [Sesamum angolense]|uniref:Protein Brevis radix-like 4 n=1 Tax=Sesamum angolense TaxID=2727404 RepID=A0AAE1WP57_9LAMI|nr:protein Brevis radix-like 4 [Sesamum angolense]